MKYNFEDICRTGRGPLSLSILKILIYAKFFLGFFILRFPQHQKAILKGHFPGKFITSLCLLPIELLERLQQIRSRGTGDYSAKFTYS